MRIAVWKFGGSSLADAAKLQRAAGLLRAEREKGTGVVCVVSARGDETDRLLEAAAALSEAPCPRELDALLATGERRSAALLALALEAQGVPAVSLSAAEAGIFAEGAHGAARIAGVDPTRLQAELAAGRMPIVTGFQGVGADGAVYTLGRGGSDASACALAAALRCPCVICTDVDGVFTADPRHVAGAKPIRALSHERMAELAARGAGVLMDRSAELARKYRVPLIVRSCAQESAGTRIAETADEEPAFTGVASEKGLTLLALETQLPSALGLEALCSLDETGAADRAAYLAFGGRRYLWLCAPREREQELRALRAGAGTARFLGGVARVSLVGCGVRQAGCLARFLRALSRAGIGIYAVERTASALTAVVAEKDQITAENAVHGEFFQ